MVAECTVVSVVSVGTVAEAEWVVLVHCQVGMTGTFETVLLGIQ